MNRTRSLFEILGPGLLWAGTAVGVSHLVQSTRAGAGYGLTLLWVVVVAMLTKYPAYEAGPRYVAATGRTLLEGYRKQGRWALWLFLAMTVATMAIVEAAVTIVTAGMASALVTPTPLGIGSLPVLGEISPVTEWSALLLALCSALLAVGRFKVLETVMKVMMVVLSVSTLAAVAVLIPATDPSRLTLMPPLPELDPTNIAFLVALIGWMPAPFDTSVWHSQWSVAKAEGAPVDWDEARLDFHVGYVGTGMLAVCFLFLGAAVLHDSGHEIPASAPAFAALLVDVYATALGDWARPVILAAAFTTMISTTLSVSDGFPRALQGAVSRLRGPETPGEDVDRTLYFAFLGLLMLGGLAIIHAFTANLKALVDVATTVSFVVAPILAVMNLVAITSDDVPAELKPPRWLLYAHYGCIAAMSVFSVGFLLWRFVL
jgi:Mn2+/Fe2+ NRAMP family transporter